MSQNFNEPPPDDPPIPLYLEDPVPTNKVNDVVKKEYRTEDLIKFIDEHKKQSDDMSQLGFKYKEYREAAKKQCENARMYQAIINKLRECDEESGYIAAVRDIIEYIRKYDCDADTIEQQFL